MPDAVQTSPTPAEAEPLVGLLAATVASCAMLALGLLLNQPTLTETVADGIAGITPIETIERMTSSIGESAKRLLFVSVLLGEVGLGTGLAVLAARARLGSLSRLAGLAAVTTAVVALALPALGQGVLGAQSRAGVGGTVFSAAGSAVLFAAAYALINRILHPRGEFAVEEATARRAFLRNGIVTVGAVVLGVGTFRWLADRLTPGESGAISSEAARTNAAVGGIADLVEAMARGVPGLSPEVTPNDRFYVVSKNLFRDPIVDEQSWRLEVVGHVERPLILTYDRMQALPAASQYFTLQCISNEVGGSLIGNAAWRGISLGDLLREAGVRAGAVDVVLRAADDYVDSIPIDKALEPATMLAYEMNGEVLPKEHGFPVRLLVPDIYGMKNVKWLTKIEVIEYDVKGYWQTRGWDDTALMQTTSRIDLPRGRSNLPAGENFVGGIAVAGARGVQKVEVSTDGGGTWSPATMKPGLGPNAWVLWLHRWELTTAEDERRILVRGTDGTGTLQDAEVRDTLPSGSSGYHAVTVHRAS